MAVNLSPVAGAAAQFLDNAGNVLTGGKLYSYLAGTTTPEATYTTIAGNVFHTNPIILDASGRVPAGGEVWITTGTQYKFVLKDANEVLIATWDNVPGTTIINAADVVFTGFKGQVGVVEDLADDDGSDWIGFQQSGTGAVARSAQDKMRDVTSVLDFGADPTGVASSVTAFQNAINSTPNSGVQVIYVPSGTYLGNMNTLVYGNRQIVWSEESNTAYTTAYPSQTRSQLQSLNGQLFEQSIDPSRHLKQFSIQNSSAGAGFIGTAVIVAGALDSVTIVDGGANYIAPRGIVTGDGLGAIATPTIVAGEVTAFTITGGTGYTTATVYVIDGPIVVCVGDSIMTPVPGQTVPSDTQYDIICRELQRQNSTRSITFFNRAIGATTWSTVNSAIPNTGNYPSWARDSSGGVTTKTWIDYIVELQPDLVVYAFGMNDRQNFVPAQLRASVQNTLTYNSRAEFSGFPQPDILFVTNVVSSAISSDANISSYNAQIGRDFVAGYERGYALANGYGFIDLHRQFRLVRDGFDPRQTFLRYFSGTTAFAWSQPITNVFQPLLTSGVSTGVGTNTLTLAASASSTTNDPTYVGAVLCIVNGNGNQQSAKIVSYDGATKVATLSDDWPQLPTVGDTYTIIPIGQSGEGLYFSTTIDCSPIGFWVDKVIEFQLSPNGVNAIEFVRISASGGYLNVSVQEYNGNVVVGTTPLGIPAVQFTTATVAPTPTSAGQTFEISCVDQNLQVLLNDNLIYSGNIAKAGGVMQPLFRYVDITTPSAPVIATTPITAVFNSHAIGQYAQYQPRLTDYELYGYGSATNYGGNALNHPSTLAINHVFKPAITNSNLSASPVLLGGSGANTANLVGVHEQLPRAFLHVTKRKLIGSTLTPLSLANNQMLEDLSSVGTSWMTSSTGVTRLVAGNEVDNNAFQMAYVHSTGTFTWSQAGTTLLSLASSGNFFPGTDDTQSLGIASRKWSVVYAGTGTINTSDARDKQQIENLSEAEKAVAIKLKGMIRKFKFNDAVEKKQGNARIHFGVIAQEVGQAFTDGGLDPNNYGIFCYDQWDDKPALLDSEGNVQEGAVVGGDRYGIRYDELFAFIIGSM
jgi:hypothetical protein